MPRDLARLVYLSSKNSLQSSSKNSRMVSHSSVCFKRQHPFDHHSKTNLSQAILIQPSGPKMTNLIKSLALLACLASVCQADGFTGDTEQPPIEPFVGEKAELFRFSRSAAKSPRQQLAKYVQQQQVENDQVNRQQVEQLNNQNEQQQQQQQVVVANELPAFSGGAKAVAPAEAPKTAEVVTTVQQAPEVGSGHQQHSSSFSSSSSSSAKKSGALSKTITTTTTTTTTTQNNQDQPQVAQIKEIRVHTVPLSEAVHYANYMVVPTSSGSSKAAHLEESSSSSSSSHKSSSTSSETEQVAVAPAPTVVVDPPPAAVAPDCVFHRLVVERPVSSQLVVNVAPEVKVSHSSSSSSHSSKVVSESAVAPPEHTVYSVRRVFVPPPVYSARVVQVPAAPSPALKEEHFRSESRSSREESHGLGHSVSSSSSSSSSRSSKSSTTTTSQTAALVAPPPPPPPPQVRSYTIVRQAAPLVAVKAAPLVEVSSGQTSDVSVDHRQSGPNYNYGYSIKQHSSEPGTKGVVVGDRVVYLK